LYNGLLEIAVSDTSGRPPQARSFRPGRIGRHGREVVLAPCTTVDTEYTDRRHRLHRHRQGRPRTPPGRLRRARLTPAGQLRWADDQYIRMAGGTEAAQKGGMLPHQRTQIRTWLTPRGVTVVEPAGELDFHSAAALEAAITASGKLPCVVVDLSRITFTDSTGINALLGANRTLRGAGGWLRLSSALDMPLRTMKIVGVDRVIDVYPTLDAALQI
jgi:anti-anti-sigma factor